MAAGKHVAEYAEKVLADYLFELTPGREKFHLSQGSRHTWVEARKERVRLNDEQQLRLLRGVAEFVRHIEPKCRFSSKGVANRHERHRRQRLVGVFTTFLMDRKDDEMRRLFQSIQGRFSLASFSTWSAAPAHYIMWFFEGLPSMTLADLGPESGVGKGIAAWSDEHAEVMAEIGRRKRRWLDVKAVMET